MKFLGGVFLIMCIIAYVVGKNTPHAHRVANDTVTPWQCVNDGGISSVWELSGGGYRIHCADGLIKFSPTGGW